MSEVVEVVVISGPRRGTIVRVDLEKQEVLSDEDVTALAKAVRDLDTAVVGVLEETRSLRRALRSGIEGL